MMWPGPEKSCLYIDPAAGLSAANQWRDLSPYQLDVQPVGYAAPNYGLSLGPSGAPRITFDGAAQRGTMGVTVSPRFYANAPQKEGTVVIVARHNAPAATDNIMSCENIAANRGFVVSMNTATRVQFYGYDAAGVLTFYPLDGDDTPYLSRTRVTIISGRCTDALARRWIDGVGRTATYAIAATPGPLAYDTAVVPTIGCRPDGIRFFDGDLYHLAIYPLIFTDQEARACSDYWRNVT